MFGLHPPAVPVPKPCCLLKEERQKQQRKIEAFSFSFARENQIDKLSLISFGHQFT